MVGTTPYGCRCESGFPRTLATSTACHNVEDLAPTFGYSFHIVKAQFKPSRSLDCLSSSTPLSAYYSIDGPSLYDPAEGHPRGETGCRSGQRRVMQRTAVAGT